MMPEQSPHSVTCAECGDCFAVITECPVRAVNATQFNAVCGTRAQIAARQSMCTMDMGAAVASKALGLISLMVWLG